MEIRRSRRPPRPRSRCAPPATELPTLVAAWMAVAPSHEFGAEDGHPQGLARGQRHRLRGELVAPAPERDAEADDHLAGGVGRRQVVHTAIG